MPWQPAHAAKAPDIQTRDVWPALPDPTALIFPKAPPRALQPHPRWGEPEAWSWGQSAHSLQPKIHLYLPPVDLRCGHLPDRKELPQKRRNDWEVLRFTYQDKSWRRSHQYTQAKAEDTGSKNYYLTWVYFKKTLACKCLAAICWPLVRAWRNR